MPKATEVDTNLTFNRRSLGIAFLFVISFWLIQFAPIVFQGQNLMGYRLLNSRFTGMEKVQTRRSVFNRLPSRDASLVLTHFPYQAYLARQFHRGVFPLWNPEIGCGQPVISDPQYKPWNPFFWPFFLFPSTWSFSLGIALMALFGCLGFLLFLREAGLEWTAATIGGILLAINPLTELTIVLSSSWAAWMFPWGLLGCELWRKGKRSGLPLVAIAGSLTVYAGHPLIAMLYVTIMVIYMIVRSSGAPIRTRLTAIIAVCVAIGLTTAVYTIPLLANIGQYWSYKSAWNGGPFASWLSLSNPKTELYIPMPVWGLAFIGAARGIRKLKWFFLCAAIYGALVMFPWIGQSSIRWMMTFGGLLVARYGEEAFWFGLLGLTALGIHALSSPGEHRPEWHEFLRLFAYGAVWYYGLNWLSWLSFSLFWPMVYKNLAHWEIVACIPVVVLMFLPKRSALIRPLSIGLLILLILPFKIQLSMSRYFSGVDLYKNPPKVVSCIKKSTENHGHGRIFGAFYKNSLMADLSSNQSLCWALPDIRITSPLILKDYKFFEQNWNNTGLFGTYCFFPKADRNLFDFLGVDRVVADAGRPLANLAVIARYDDLAVQSVEGTAPIARGVGRWIYARSEEAAISKTIRLINNGSWKAEVVLEGIPFKHGGQINGFVPPSIAIREDGPSRFKWNIEGTTESVIAITESFHPGWKASIDGSQARIYKAYGAFMAIRMPAGKHSLLLTFHSRSFWVGIFLAIAGWVGIAAWFLLRLPAFKRAKH